MPHMKNTDQAEQIQDPDSKIKNSDPSKNINKKNENTKIKNPSSQKYSNKDKDKAPRFGITATKTSDFSSWYLQVLSHSNFTSPYPVRGCHILQPPCTFAWRTITEYINKRLACPGVSEMYFPMLIPEHNLTAETDHIAGFEPEVAWITRSGSKTLDAPLAVRPTSETIIYPYFSDMVRSRSQLPVKINQWCNILRWEVKSTVPLVRGREFLWQEGHCCYETKGECDSDVVYYLEMYEDVYRDLLGVPVVKGVKSENEKFGGAEYTMSVEAWIADARRGVQAATSHSLGTNFARMFNITTKDSNDKKIDKKKSKTDVVDNDNNTMNVINDLANVTLGTPNYVHQSSWGLTTRSIGVAIMIHSDNTDLVLPPRIAMTQVIIVPCGKTNTDIQAYIQEIYNDVKNKGVRVKIDDRENLSPGYKFNYWEIRGVPLRIEIGARDVKDSLLTVVQRNNMQRKAISNTNVGEHVVSILDRIHDEMYGVAKKQLDDSIKRVDSMEMFSRVLGEGNIALMDWCNTAVCEEEIKEETRVYKDGEIEMAGAKSLCLPFGYDILGEKCARCERVANCVAMFGRTY